MKKIIPVLALVAGFTVGFLTSGIANRKPIGVVQVDSSTLMNLTNTIEAGQAREAGLETQLSNAVAEIGNLNSQLGAAIDQVNKLAPEAAKAQKVPVAIQKELTLSGNRYHFSTYGRAIHINVTFQNGSNQKQANFVVGPPFGKNYDGWDPATGDAITISADGYDTKTINF